MRPPSPSLSPSLPYSIPCLSSAVRDGTYRAAGPLYRFSDTDGMFYETITPSQLLPIVTPQLYHYGPVPMPSPAPAPVSKQAHIPRPPNAWILFRTEMHRKSGERESSQSKELAKLWEVLPKAEKDVWRRKAEKVREEHRRKYPNYTYCPRKSKKSRGGSKAPFAKRKKSAPIIVRERQPRILPAKSKEVCDVIVRTRDESASWNNIPSDIYVPAPEVTAGPAEEVHNAIAEAVPATNEVVASPCEATDDLFLNEVYDIPYFDGSDNALSIGSTSPIVCSGSPLTPVDELPHTFTSPTPPLTAGVELPMDNDGFVWNSNDLLLSPLDLYTPSSFTGLWNAMGMSNGAPDILDEYHRSLNETILSDDCWTADDFANIMQQDNSLFLQETFITPSFLEL